jgi:hypothetical protein
MPFPVGLGRDQSFCSVLVFLLLLSGYPRTLSCSGEFRPALPLTSHPQNTSLGTDLTAPKERFSMSKRSNHLACKS